MNFEVAGRNVRRKPNASDAELDALVVREVEALAARRSAPAAKRRAADDDRTLAGANEQDGRRDEVDIEQNGPAARARRSDSPDERQALPRESNVIGIRHAGPERTSDFLFSADEEKFIEQAVAFLKGRENADAVIEELWTHAVLDREEGIVEQLGDAMRVADFAESEGGADFIEDRLLNADDDGEGPGAHHPDQVTPIRSDRARNDMAAPSRPTSTEAEVKPPKAERPKPKSTGGDPGKRGATE
jgi:hypothetical protein